MNVKGKLLKILSLESGVARNGNPWKKQEFVIETADQFPKKICFTLFNDKVNLIGGIKEGEEIDVSFDIESREFNNKWYHNLNAWKIDRQSRPSDPAGIPPPPEFDLPSGDFEDQPGDLPF